MLHFPRIPPIHILLHAGGIAKDREIRKNSLAPEKFLLFVSRMFFLLNRQKSNFSSRLFMVQIASFVRHPMHSQTSHPEKEEVNFISFLSSS